MLAAGTWRAPTRDAPLAAVVSVPGSKSVTNRALLLSALASGPSVVRRPLVASDTEAMAAALRALGTEITWTDSEPNGAADLLVRPRPWQGPADIRCGLAGTVMRFVPPVAALAVGAIHVDADPEARHRPIAAMLSALRALGVQLGDATGLPFTLTGTGRVHGGVVEIDAAESSQFISALLLAGARYDDGLDLRHTGKPLPSTPHIAMTVDMLRRRGVAVDDSEPNRWLVSPGRINALDVDVEPDLSSAAPFLAAALVCGGTVTVRDWPEASSQPGDQLRWLLSEFGGTVDHGPIGLVVRGSGQLTGIDVDLHDVGELTPVLAAMAALADGPSYLRGIAHLRGHETDRLAALATELNRLGGDVTETADGLAIAPRPLHGGVFRACHDHRLAQAGAVLGLAVPDVEVDDIATTAKTFPGFADAWTAMVA